ncbi:LysR family transcriptional regulator [Novosphingobium sp.]|uniref:LysR family transcriptional regulator n=1 Tax=Novosphingobium sp. TaxID=1874826 RepID=UPI0028ABA802|nr:LysR family transcriptional regulator [Novosphingobium sp.]
MRIVPRHLQAVLAVVEHGSFGRAADALGMSQPALSKNIALLEKRIGAKVFDRGARGSSLTDAGRIIARRAADLDSLLFGVEEELRGHVRDLVGPLKVGATPPVMIGLVPEAMSRAAQAVPNMIASITAGLDVNLVPALQRGEIDLLVSSNDDIHAVPPDLVHARLMDEYFLIGVAPRHRLAGEPQIRIEDLREEAWVLPSEATMSHQILDALFTAAGVPWPERAIHTDAVAAQERLICNANRVAVVSRLQLVGRDLPFPAIPLAHAPSRVVGVKQRKNVAPSPLAEIFVGNLHDIAAEIDLEKR